jgi:hypothetical protein
MKIPAGACAVLVALLAAALRAAPSSSYLWLADYSPTETVAARFAAPDGFERVDAKAGSFGDWLRYLPLKKGCPPVLLHDGRKKANQDAHAAVVDIDTGTKDLQQCADAVIRLRAEYLYSTKDYAAIHFNFTSGDRAEFAKWAEGWRPTVSARSVKWTKSAAKDDSHASLRAWLDVVFAYAGTASLAKELSAVKTEEMRIGDVFIHGGSPGHAVVVVDMAVNKRTGKKVFMLAQGYMPAQDIHVLKNPAAGASSPWYDLDFGETLRTPEWTFAKDELKRFQP